MSSRASPGSGSDRRTRCTRRSLLVTVPSASQKLADAGSTTSASSAVFVRKMSCTTRHSSPFSSSIACPTSASDCAGFSPMTKSAVRSFRFIAENIWVRCQPFFGGMVAPQARSNRSRIASSSTSWKPVSLFGSAPMSPPPCTLFWPRSGLHPQP